MNQAQEINFKAFSPMGKLEMAERLAVSFERPFSNVTRYVFDDNSTLEFIFGEFRSVKTVIASK